MSLLLRRSSILHSPPLPKHLITDPIRLVNQQPRTTVFLRDRQPQFLTAWSGPYGGGSGEGPRDVCGDYADLEEDGGLVPPDVFCMTTR